LFSVYSKLTHPQKTLAQLKIIFSKLSRKDVNLVFENVSW